MKGPERGCMEGEKTEETSKSSEARVNSERVSALKLSGWLRNTWREKS